MSVIKNSFKKIGLWISLVLSSGFGLGLMPWAPGTWGSLLGIPLGLWFLQIDPNLALTIMVILFFIFSGISQVAGKFWKKPDAKQIVCDEVLGQAIALMGTRYLGLKVPVVVGTAVWSIPNTWAIVASFLLFRVFDIFKPFPARTFDRKMKNGFGVVADDVAAGAYAALALYLVSRILLNNPA